MRVLMDTNIFIYREDYRVIPDSLQDLLKAFANLGTTVVVHPFSLNEVERDQNSERKQIVLSKIRTYPLLESPPNPESDPYFRSVVNWTESAHEIVDNNLLYCVQKNAVDFLVTEDQAIHRKSDRLGISERVFNLDEALAFFAERRPVEVVPVPPTLSHVPIHNLDLSDPIFDTLKAAYPKFTDWFRQISREGRKAWVYYADGALGAILILKNENEAIPCIPPLPRERRVKICTLKVAARGYKIGELFIKISVRLAITNNIDTLYLTHFVIPGDELTGLIEKFGFRRWGRKNGEDVFVKSLVPERGISDPADVFARFYPSFYDGEKVGKFIVPIQPTYHDRLFTDYPGRQPTLFESGGEPIVEGNTITKGYLCHSRIRMSEFDVLFFYRSHDEKRVTTLGIVENVYHDITDPVEIIRYVGKRSVYAKTEIEEMAKRPTKLILFRQLFYLQNPIGYDQLRNINVLAGPPQSIVQLSQEKYLTLKTQGGIDERFTID